MVQTGPSTTNPESVRRVNLAMDMSRPIIHYSFDDLGANPNPIPSTGLDSNAIRSICHQVKSLIVREPEVTWPLAEVDEWHRQTHFPLHGIQLNGLSSRLYKQQRVQRIISHVLESAGRPIQVISQLHSDILEYIAESTNPNRVAAIPENCQLLLDTSGGLGRSFEREKYARIIELLKLMRPEQPISIAGGLGPGELENFDWLCKRFGPLSADAETKLRDNYNPNRPHLSRFSPQKAANFILEASEIIKSHQ